jgi:hypothetical protein
MERRVHRTHGRRALILNDQRVRLAKLVRGSRLGRSPSRQALGSAAAWRGSEHSEGPA